MDDNRVIDNNVLVDDEWGGVDYENLEAPTKWRFDEGTGKLHMLFKDGGTPKLLCSSAVMSKSTEFYHIAVLASSQEVLLWYTNQSDKLNASMKREKRL